MADKDRQQDQQQPERPEELQDQELDSASGGYVVKQKTVSPEDRPRS